MSDITFETLHDQGRSTQRTRMWAPMRDGVLLATDIYSDTLLDRTRALPVLLERTPYDIRAMRPSDGRHADGGAVSPESGAAFFVERGYIVVRQDCRGRGDSEGVFSKYTGEAEDGFDTQAWLAAQPWCDGRIITAGVSYSAHVQAAAASVGAPATAAMILDSGGFSNAFEAGGRFGGAFELKQVIWAYRHALKSPAAEEDPVLAANLEGQDLAAWFRSMPWRKGYSPLSGSTEYEDFLFEQWSHEELDGFWTQPGMYARGFYENFPDVPSMHISSWYDPYVFTAVENFHSLRKLKAAPTFLVLGPWIHGARSVTWSGDVDFGPEATLDGNLSTDYLTFKAQWLDQVLNDEPVSLAAVSYFLMGGGSGRKNPDGRLDHGGTWRFAAEWPPAETQQARLFLAPDGSLSFNPPSRAGAISYDFDPSHPVPSMGGGITSGEPLMHGGAFDQTPTADTYAADTLLPLASRPDVVSFQTAPLEKGLAIIGDLTLELDFSSSAPDTDITVKLVDVYPANADYPAGFAMNITDGMLRCRYREGFESPVLMQPGTTYGVTVRLPDTANYFSPGHRIRVDVSSSNFPRCDVNPNTGNAVVADRTSQVARNTLHLGRSHLTVHIVGSEVRMGH
ncbi:CocE/NonD family hydrolase [Cryobacterium tepidiphilum]|uniref:CocE/NonD family hydrolase n=1 Tax=Cryobacterium tepidiphilum TaxID=2486026 RepID=A0A3M8L0G0_9MICO|nr:CocE/NonD family hydrolase [Cryobacterium tepidiphilum]RNE59027.1 CocE/NonD family hydrolase [Cryobacterium tepidiphilum]